MVMLRIVITVVVVAVVEEFPRRIAQRQNVIRLSCSDKSGQSEKINKLTNAIIISYFLKILGRKKVLR